MPANVTRNENRRAVIAFARRLADHLAMGAEEDKALSVVAKHFRDSGRDADLQIAVAADAVASSRNEGRGKAAWEEQVEAFGDHLVSLVCLAHEAGAGGLESALRAAAGTLESDVRTGYDGFPKKSGAVYL